MEMEKISLGQFIAMQGKLNLALKKIWPRLQGHMAQNWILDTGNQLEEKLAEALLLYSGPVFKEKDGIVYFSLRFFSEHTLDTWLDSLEIKAEQFGTVKEFFQSKLSMGLIGEEFNLAIIRGDSMIPKANTGSIERVQEYAGRLGFSKPGLKMICYFVDHFYGITIKKQLGLSRLIFMEPNDDGLFFTLSDYGDKFEIGRTQFHKPVMYPLPYTGFVYSGLCPVE